MAQVREIVTARLVEVVRSVPHTQRKLLGILNRSLNDGTGTISLHNFTKTGSGRTL